MLGFVGIVDSLSHMSSWFALGLLGFSWLVPLAAQGVAVAVGIGVVEHSPLSGKSRLIIPLCHQGCHRKCGQLQLLDWQGHRR